MRNACMSLFRKRHPTGGDTHRRTGYAITLRLSRCVLVNQGKLARQLVRVNLEDHVDTLADILRDRHFRARMKLFEAIDLTLA